MKQDYITPSSETWYKNRLGEFYLPKEIVKNKVNNNDPTTFVPLLELGDYPYIAYEWFRLVDHYGSSNIFGRYLAKMRLADFKGFSFKDSDFLNSFYFKHINISCLNHNNGCDYCDARCPEYVDSAIVRDFLLAHKNELHDMSIQKIDKKRLGDNK